MAERTTSGQPGTGTTATQSTTLPPDGFSSFPRVKAFTGGLSRETIRLWEIAGRFPRHISPTQRTALWPNSELHRWASNPEAYRAVSADQQAA